jgi:hypothetical protein
MITIDVIKCAGRLGLVLSTGVLALQVQAATIGAERARSITAGAVVMPQASALGADLGVQASELAPGVGADAAGAPARPASGRPMVNRHMSRSSGDRGDDASDDGTDSAQPTLLQHFDGLNHRQNRLASGGNQFSLEPPDQGLCVGNGNVLEVLNDVLRVYDTTGNPLTAPIALNSFLGYPPAINRTTGARGPFVTDPSCLFDAATQRFFLIVLTLDVDPSTGAFVGSNHIDLAVSRTANPNGAWKI